MDGEGRVVKIIRLDEVLDLYGISLTVGPRFDTVKLLLLQSIRLFSSLFFYLPRDKYLPMRKFNPGYCRFVTASLVLAKKYYVCK
ncbi:hypothetical protein RUM44_010346 [Polyplax serrata]|uniref:LAGLIDADG homing endonuclease n=1 Tax=Polyplax serrata TaxID=468196 RepID=A0ABR1AVA8_POLSC